MGGREVVKSPHACISWGGSKVFFQNAPPLCLREDYFCLLWDRVVPWGWWPATGATTAGGCRGGKTLPWLVAGGAGTLQHGPCASGAATQNPLGGRRFSMRKNNVPKANKQSWNHFRIGFLKAPFAGWEIQREHPLHAGARRVLLRIYHPTSQFFKGKINEHFIQRIWAAYQEYFQQCTSDTLQIVLTEAKVKCHTLRSDAVCSWKRACTAFRDWQLNPSFFQLPTYGMK